ncbi:MAG TPA: hypothetical protein DCE56_37070 [Cyanobacteria bacterium UBA8553]|nr:hypothetical protein [Cyanobacteria bacterium UBA8553]HAJ64459.1 hypothetical protein [Cyanobacteria bacterium UBA8543]
MAVMWLMWRHDAWENFLSDLLSTTPMHDYLPALTKNTLLDEVKFTHLSEALHLDFWLLF